MSACDTCRLPGACCVYFWHHRLYHPDQTRDEVRALMRKGEDGFGHECEPVPFDPIRPGGWYAHDGDAEPGAVMWIVSCPKLIPEIGRCSIYDARPEVCRDFEPGSNQLCVEYVPKPEDFMPFEKKDEDGG